MSILGDAYVRVRPDFTTFRRDVSSGINKSMATSGKDAGEQFGSGFQTSASSAMRKAFVALGGIAIGTTIVRGFSSAISASSDLAESINAVNVSFGSAAQGVLALGENASTTVGLSREQFNSLAVQFSGFAKTLVGESGDVSGAIEKITGRAADFASVMNLDVSEAARLFQSGLAGETEPLRRYGIDLSAAAVNAYAYANGIAEAGTKLTETQKVQARYLLLMEQTAHMHGDFANTSDSLANRQRILAARFEDTKAALGNALLPAAEATLGALDGLLTVFTAIPGPVKVAVGAFVGLRVAMALLSGHMKAAGISAGTFTAALRLMGTAGVTAAAKSALGGIVSMLGGPWGIAMAGATVALGLFIERQQKAKERVAELTQTLDQQNGALTEASTDALLKTITANEKFTASLDRAGISLSDYLGYVLDNENGTKLFQDAVKKSNLTQREQDDIIKEGLVNIRDRRNEIDASRAALNRQKDAQKAANDVVEEGIVLNTQLGLSEEEAADAAESLMKAKQKLRDELNKVWSTLTLVNEGFTTNRGYTAALEAGIDDLNAAIKEEGVNFVDTAVKGGRHVSLLDLTNDAGRKAESAIFGLAETITSKTVAEAQAIQETQGHKAALKFLDEQTRVTKDGQSKLERSLYEVFYQAGLSKDRAREYARQLSLTPKQVRTRFDTPGARTARNELDRLKREMNQIGVSIKALQIYAKNPNISWGAAQTYAAYGNQKYYRGGAGGYNLPSTISGSVPTTDSTAEAIKAQAKRFGAQLDQIKGIVDRSKERMDRRESIGTGHVFKGNFPITQPYWKHGYAEDLGTPSGTPIYAPWSGRLVNSSYYANGRYYSYGRLAEVYNSDGRRFRVAHLSRFARSGEIRKGQLMGYTGNTGNSTGPHAHVEVIAGGRFQNPQRYVKYDTGGVLPHGTTAINLSRKPEAILTNDQWSAIERLGRGLNSQPSGGTTINITNVHPQAEPSSVTTNKALEYAAALGRF